jgi:Tetratricopeptide repeat
MRQLRLVLGLSIVPLIAWVKLEIPTIGQVPSSFFTLEKEEIIAADQLNQQVIKLYNQGKYEEAIPLAKRILAIREKILGENHPSFAASLNNLALLYDSQ